MRVIKSRRYLTRVGDILFSFKNFCNKPEGKRPSRTPRCRWENIIKTDTTEIGWECINWINFGLGHGPVVEFENAVIKLRVP
jgi:hypothetical protein